MQPYKAKVVLEALKEKETLQQLSSKYEVHANQIAQWKREFLNHAEDVFSSKKAEEKSSDEQEKEALYSKIGRLQTENYPPMAESLGEMSLGRKRHLVLRENSPLSVVRQCEILEIHRSGVYFKPKMEKALNLHLMRLIDEKFMDCPFYGVPRMTTWWLRKDMGYIINEKRVARLYRLMGLQTIFPKKNLSKRNQKHKVYPYLLKNLAIVRPNQVWQTDITYIPLERGFMYNDSCD